MAQPFWKATGSPQAAGVAITCPWPTHVAGDVALLIVMTRGDQPATLSTPAGFAAVPGAPHTPGTSTTATLNVWWCRATSAAMASPVVADSGNVQTGVIVTYGQCAPTGDPWDVLAFAAKTTPSTASSWPSVTTTVPDTLIVQAAAAVRDVNNVEGWDSFTNAALTAVTQRYDKSTDTGTGGALVVLDGVRAATGAIGNTTATLAASLAETYLTIALKGETTGGGDTGEVTAPPAVVEASGSPVITGSGAATAPAGEAHGEDFIGITGTGAVSAPAAVVDAAGFAWPTDAEWSVRSAILEMYGNLGLGAASAAAATVSGSGAPVITGTGEVAAAPGVAAATGSGSLGTSGTGSVEAPAAQAAGSGTPIITGTGTVVAPAGVASVTALHIPEAVLVGGPITARRVRAGTITQRGRA